MKEKKLIDFVSKSEKCIWNKEIKCEKDWSCSGCEHQPPYSKKANESIPPVLVPWEAYDEGSIFPRCPSCGKLAYEINHCVFCGQRFITEEIDIDDIECEQQPIITVMDCFICGGKGTFECLGPANRHIHGHCKACGATIVQ